MENPSRRKARCRLPRGPLLAFTFYFFFVCWPLTLQGLFAIPVAAAAALAILTALAAAAWPPPLAAAAWPPPLAAAAWPPPLAAALGSRPWPPTLAAAPGSRRSATWLSLLGCSGRNGSAALAVAAWPPWSQRPGRHGNRCQVTLAAAARLP